MSTTVAVILACVGFGIIVVPSLCAVALIIRVFNAIGALVEGLTITSEAIIRLHSSVKQLEDRLKAPEIRNYIIMDGGRKDVLRAVYGHVNGDGVPVPQKPFGLMDNTGDPVTILVIKRGLGGIMGGLEE